MTRPLSVAVVLAAILAQAPAQADEAKFEAALSGAEEVPPVATESSGAAEFESGGPSVRFELQ